MTRYGKGTAINLTRITSPDQINVINDNFRKIQTQLMGVKNYLEPIAQAGQDISDWIHQYIGYEPPVSHPQMVNYAQKQIAMSPTPPDDPDVGDVWFVTDDSGNVIAIRHWDGTQWVDDVNNQAIQDAISQAQQETEEAKQQAQDAVDRANQAVQSANDAIQQAQQSFDAAQEALTNATNAQSKADDAMTQAQTAFDNAQNALTTAQNALDATNVLSQKVDANTGDISTLYQTTDSLGSRITTAEGNISDLQQTDASFATRITNAEGNITTLTQTALGLQTSVSDLQGDVSTLTQTANSLNSTITNVQNALNNLQIGGRNLLSNTKDWNGWTAFNGNAYKTSNTYEGCVIQEQKADWSYLRITSQKQLIPGKTYTASVWLKASVGGILTPYYSHESNSDGSTRVLAMQSIDGDTKVTTEWKRWYVTFVANGTNHISGARVEAQGFGTSGAILYVAGLKLEEGNRPTTWTPAPEDYDARFSSINQTIDSITTTVQDAQGDISALQQTANSLATRITNAEGNISTLTQTVDGLQTQVTDNKNNISTLTQTATSLQSRLTTAEGNISTLTQTANSLTSQISSKADQSWVSSQISQLSDAINLRVQKNDVINQINISTEGILIDGKKIHITGQTTIDNAVIKDAMIESVSASKISATSLSAISANLGNVTAGNITGVNILVNDGDIAIKDANTNMQYSLIKRTNYLKDHSFELVDVDWYTTPNYPSYGVYQPNLAIEVTPYWYLTVGNPLLVVSYYQQALGSTIFGSRSVLVNSSNYFIQAGISLKPGTVYTLSGHFKKPPERWVRGTPQMTVQFVDDSETVRWTASGTCSIAVPADGSVIRFAFTFTTPTNMPPVTVMDAGYRVLVTAKDSGWVVADGIQLVEGDEPTVYDDQNDLYAFLSGLLGGAVINVDRLGAMNAGFVTVNVEDNLTFNQLTSFHDSGAKIDQYGNIVAKYSVSSGAYWNVKDYSGKVIIKVPWGSSPSPIFFYPQGSDHGLEFMKLDANSSGDHVGIRGAGQAILKFLSSSDTVQIRTTSDTAYGTIYAAAFNNGSLAEYKQDITPWQESVWDTVKNMTLYKYRLKSEVEKGVDKIRYGFVIGEGYDAPPEHVVTPEGDGVEQYLMNSLSLKGLQEAIFTIENILQQLENFNQRISSLEQKIV